MLVIYKNRFELKLIQLIAMSILINPISGLKLKDQLVLFDFTNDGDISNWIEQSDTKREVGMSKAVLSIQKTQIFQRAIFFSLLNPQPNGAGFAGMRVDTNLNLQDYKGIHLNVRGNGENSRYKVVLRHRNLNDEPNPSYEQFFKVTLNEVNFETISLNFKDFKPYYRGKLVNDTIPLDQSAITNFGLQINGGVYMEDKQKGSSALEINWISAFN